MFCGGWWWRWECRGPGGGVPRSPPPHTPLPRAGGGPHSGQGGLGLAPGARQHRGGGRARSRSGKVVLAREEVDPPPRPRAWDENSCFLFTLPGPSPSLQVPPRWGRSGRRGRRGPPAPRAAAATCSLPPPQLAGPATDLLLLPEPPPCVLSLRGTPSPGSPVARTGGPRRPGTPRPLGEGGGAISFFQLVSPLCIEPHSNWL